MKLLPLARSRPQKPLQQGRTAGEEKRVENTPPREKYNERSKEVNGSEHQRFQKPSPPRKPPEFATPNLQGQVSDSFLSLSLSFPNSHIPWYLYSRGISTVFKVDRSPKLEHRHLADRNGTHIPLARPMGGILDGWRAPDDTKINHPSSRWIGGPHAC